MPHGKTEKSTLGYFTIGIVALFLVGFFLLVMFGAKSYRDTANGQSGNMDTRAQLAYLLTTLRANDTAGAVTVAGTEQEPVLIVRDGDSGYAFRIYRHAGHLVEDFAPADDPLRPEEALSIGATETLRVTRTGDVLCITTDAGSVLVAQRSGGEQP